MNQYLVFGFVNFIIDVVSVLITVDNESNIIFLNVQLKSIVKIDTIRSFPDLQFPIFELNNGKYRIRKLHIPYILRIIFCSKLSNAINIQEYTVHL